MTPEDGVTQIEADDALLDAIAAGAADSGADHAVTVLAGIVAAVDEIAPRGAASGSGRRLRRRGGLWGISLGVSIVVAAGGGLSAAATDRLPEPVQRFVVGVAPIVLPADADQAVASPTADPPRAADPDSSRRAPAPTAGDDRRAPTAETDLSPAGASGDRAPDVGYGPSATGGSTWSRTAWTPHSSRGSWWSAAPAPTYYPAPSDAPAAHAAPTSSPTPTSTVSPAGGGGTAPVRGPQPGHVGHGHPSPPSPAAHTTAPAPRQPTQPPQPLPSPTESARRGG
ncbi:hypothetical protein [Gryllotalpicola protaetiae]|uniref:Uncharacterized protein n=1 Tax=Gryllotalpicola protaetiae TaxID=2419771 RepID=A0A387BQI6_9MICO|nr:hypothetical protein [Gryllotalpicola protaetiae]AYG04802.1 hypothetical protein D7I44_15545 [Gryllotalpicola protaetiae]